MHPFRFYSASTSAIETPEKKTYIIVELSGFPPLCTPAWIDCVCCVVCMRVSRKGARKVLHTSSQFFFFFFSFFSFFFFLESVGFALVRSLACVDIGKASCIYQAAEKHE